MLEIVFYIVCNEDILILILKVILTSIENK